MLKVGLTGGIGSGKSVVASVFTRLDIPVFYADEAAATLTRNDQRILSALKVLFGDTIVDNHGQLQRKKLRNIIFQDEQARMKVNNLIHPLVRNKFAAWCSLQAGKPFVLQEAAILFESGAYEGMDRVIMVSAPEDIRIKWVMLRDGAEKDEIQAVIASQMSDDEKIKRSDFVLYNDEQQLLVPQVLKVYNTLLKMAEEKTDDV